MNKAFVREPEPDGNVQCPRCGAIGMPVYAGPLDTHIRPEFRQKMGEAAWFCSAAKCDVAYFNAAGDVVSGAGLTSPIYPLDLDAPICGCFGLNYDDVAADVREGTPTRIRELLAKSKSPAARCQTLAADGRCCLAVVQELYLRLRSQA